MIHAVTLSPHDHPSPPLVEADAELLRMFDAWHSAEPEDRPATGHALIAVMNGRRGIWFGCASHVFYLRSDGVVRVFGRRLPRMSVIP